MAEPTKVGTWVRERRQELGLTRKQLTDIIWSKPGYIGGLERGERLNPGRNRYFGDTSWRTALRLADTLSQDDDDRAGFLELLGLGDHAPDPRLPTIVEWRRQLPAIN